MSLPLTPIETEQVADAIAKEMSGTDLAFWVHPHHQGFAYYMEASRFIPIAAYIPEEVDFHRRAFAMFIGDTLRNAGLVITQRPAFETSQPIP